MCRFIKNSESAKNRKTRIDFNLSHKNNSSESYHKKSDISVLPNVTRNLSGLHRDFFDESYLKILKMTPSRNKKIKTGLKKNFPPLFLKDLIKLSPKNQKESIVVNSIEIQTTISDDEKAQVFV